MENAPRATSPRRRAAAPRCRAQHGSAAPRGGQARLRAPHTASCQHSACHVPSVSIQRPQHCAQPRCVSCSRANRKGCPSRRLEQASLRQPAQCQCGSRGGRGAGAAPMPAARSEAGPAALQPTAVPVPTKPCAESREYPILNTFWPYIYFVAGVFC